MKTFNARLVRRERLTPEEYLNRRAKDPKSLKRVRIIPPSLTDDDDYGSFEIEKDTPLYEVECD